MATKMKITRDQVIADLRKLVETHPDRKAQAFYFVPGTKPAVPECGVGHLFYQYELLDTVVTDLSNGSRIETILGCGDADCCGNGQLMRDAFTDEALEVLSAFQDHQDEGLSWSDAFEQVNVDA